jgi:hypothetical protein
VCWIRGRGRLQLCERYLLTCLPSWLKCGELEDRQPGRAASASVCLPGGGGGCSCVKGILTCLLSLFEVDWKPGPAVLA